MATCEQKYGEHDRLLNCPVQIVFIFKLKWPHLATTSLAVTEKGHCNQARGLQGTGSFWSLPGVHGQEDRETGPTGRRTAWWVVVTELQSFRP